MANKDQPGVITCKAALAFSESEPLRIETIQVDPPRGHEARVRIVASGICHSDESVWKGLLPDMRRFPQIYGHEGAGIVESVGDDVTSVAPGDHVLLFPIFSCEECDWCSHKNNNICREQVKQFTTPELYTGGGPRFSLVEIEAVAFYITHLNRRIKGKNLPKISFFSKNKKDGGGSEEKQKINHFQSLSSFSEYVVVPERQLIKISDHSLPLDKLCLLGCGVTTGIGAVLNTAKAHSGSVCAVFGLGCVGLAAVVGCRLAGAKRIFGIDTNGDKHDVALKLGCTDFLNPNDFDKPIEKILQEKTGGGCDYTFEAIGSTSTMESAFESCRPAGGICCVIGAAAVDQKMSVSPMSLILDKRLVGTLDGGYRPPQVHQLIELVASGEIQLQHFITHRMSLNEINEGFELLRQGKPIRVVVDLSSQ